MMSEAFERLKQREQTLMCRTYSRYPLSVVHGKGSRLWDVDGKEYVDLLSGIAVIGLGHGNEEIAEVMAEQARKLVHVSNLFYTLRIIHSGRFVPFDSWNHFTMLSLFRASAFLCCEVSLSIL